MHGKYCLFWEEESDNYKTYHMRSFETEDEAVVYAKANGIVDYGISRT